jgi:damage-control phosphatase, subfamily I
VRTYLDCFPCFLRQIIEASRVAGMDETQQHTLLQRVLRDAETHDMRLAPSEMSSRIHALVRQSTGNRDPYLGAKASSTRQALAMYPRLKSLIQAADDPLETAVRLSIAGNIMDLGVLKEFDLAATVQRVLVEAFAINDLPALRAALARSRHILYMGDNAGETVFDRLLIETLAAPVTYVVKSGPTVNDATHEDALAAGLYECADVVDNGFDGLGTLLHHCSPAFLARFRAAELIIAKGQANFECLDGTGAPAFFLLQAKCEVIARHLGVPQFALVLKQELPLADEQFSSRHPAQLEAVVPGPCTGVALPVL